jgi:putative transposase
MAKRDSVTLTADERAQLPALTQNGKVSARPLTRAHILPQADAGGLDTVMAAARHVGIATVERVRQRFVAEGLEAALRERPRPGGRRKLDGKPAAFLLARACRTPPEGRTAWTGPLLAHQRVECRVRETLSDETVRRTLPKTPSSRGNTRPGVSRAYVRSAWGLGKLCWLATPSRMIAKIRWPVVMNVPTHWAVKYATHCQSVPASLPGMTPKITGRGHAIC